MVCCRCNKTGRCRNCSCVKAGKSCRSCLPIRLGQCENHSNVSSLTDHASSPLQPQLTPLHPKLALLQPVVPDAIDIPDADPTDNPTPTLRPPPPPLPDFKPMANPAFTWGNP